MIILPTLLLATFPHTANHTRSLAVTNQKKLSLSFPPSPYTHTSLGVQGTATGTNEALTVVDFVLVNLSDCFLAIGAPPTSVSSEKWIA